MLILYNWWLEIQRQQIQLQIYWQNNIYIHFNIGTFPQHTGYIYQMTRLLLRSGHDFRHILASCHTTSPPKIRKFTNKNPQTRHASINGHTKPSFTKHIKATLSH